MRFRSISTPLLAAVLVLGAVSPRDAGAADDKTKAAASHFQRGVTLFNEADYGGALAEFRKAYATVPNVNVLYNIGQTQYQLQKYADALRTLEKYLADGGEAHKGEAETTIGVLRSRVGKIDVTTNVLGAEVTVDDEPAGKTPLAVPIVVSIGRRRVTVSASGRSPVTKSVDVTSGETSSLALNLEARDSERAPYALPPAAAPEGRSHDGLVIAGWITTGTLAAATSIVGLMALNSASKLRAARDAYPGNGSDLHDRATTTTTLSVTADVLGAATVVAAGLSLYWTLTNDKSAKKAGLRLLPTQIAIDGAF